MVSLCIRSVNTVCKLPRTYSESGRCSASYFARYYTSINQNHLDKYCVFPPRAIQRSASGDNYVHARTVDTLSPPKSPLGLASGTTLMHLSMLLSPTPIHLHGYHPDKSL